jgi:hypothetical protein
MSRTAVPQNRSAYCALVAHICFGSLFCFGQTPLSQPKVAPTVTPAISPIDSKQALDRAQSVMGVPLPASTARMVDRADDSLIADRPPSTDDKAWLVETAPLQFTLVEEVKDAKGAIQVAAVRTPSLKFEILIRASDGVVLRIQTSPVPMSVSGAKVESLPAATYRARCSRECGWAVHGQVAAPKSTLADVLKSIYTAFGGPEGAQQFVVYLWNWSESQCVNKAPQNVWSVDIRSDPQKFSQTNGLEDRIAKENRPAGSNLVHMVADGSNEWLKASNFPKPRVVGSDGKVIDAGDSETSK